MKFANDSYFQSAGATFGYIAGYFLFTTILFSVLLFSKKLPELWSYFHIMGITFLIALTGTLIKRFLR